jgi:hypothetical protein
MSLQENPTPVMNSIREQRPANHRALADTRVCGPRQNEGLLHDPE